MGITVIPSEDEETDDTVFAGCNFEEWAQTSKQQITTETHGALLFQRNATGDVSSLVLLEVSLQGTVRVQFGIIVTRLSSS